MQLPQKFVVINQCYLSLQDNCDSSSKTNFKITHFCTNPTGSHKFQMSHTYGG